MGRGEIQIMEIGYMTLTIILLPKTNSDPTFYVSSGNFINKTISGEIEVNTSSDDDFIGFVLDLNSLPVIY